MCPEPREQPLSKAQAADQRSILQDRALMLKRARAFFADRNVMEVDVPSLTPYPPLDAHIDVLEVALDDSRVAYLHTSPEYGMKKLLSRGCGDIYQMSHVFRAHEKGHLHNVEFMMVEWYRIGVDYFAFIDETIAFLSLFVGNQEKEFLTYSKAFQQLAGIDPYLASHEEILSVLQKHSISFPPSIKEDRELLLQLILSQCIEPNLGTRGFTVLYDYPAHQAALAKTYIQEGRSVAKRFEIYYKGIELTNGYDELQDPAELKARLEVEIAKRDKLLPLDTALIEALERGLPPCYGVAVGFDRLMMLRHQLPSIDAVIPLSTKF